MNNDPTSSERKEDHIDLAFQSQIGQNAIDDRFFYEPMLSGHPDTNFPDFILPHENTALKRKSVRKCLKVSEQNRYISELQRCFQCVVNEWRSASRDVSFKAQLDGLPACSQLFSVFCEQWRTVSSEIFGFGNFWQNLERRRPDA